MPISLKMAKQVLCFSYYRAFGPIYAAQGA
jgi:hypothetical protein